MKKEIIKWVQIVVNRLIREKRLTSLDREVLISAGYLGYAQSLKRFDPERGVKFKTFAEYRIKGAVLDEVRKMIGDERCKNKRPMQVRDYDMEAVGDDGVSQNGFESRYDIDHFYDTAPLDDKEKIILRCRVSGMNLHEIGEKFGFTSSRASQVVSEIKRKISPWFTEYLGENFKLAEMACPKCGHVNETLEFSAGFDCESCSAEIKIKRDGELVEYHEKEYS